MSVSRRNPLLPGRAVLPVRCPRHSTDGRRHRSANGTEPWKTSCVLPAPPLSNGTSGKVWRNSFLLRFGPPGVAALPVRRSHTPLMTTCIAVPMERSRGKRVSFVQHHCSRAALRAMDFVILFFFRLFLVIVNRGWIQRSQGAFHIVCPDLQTKERWNPGCSQGLHDMRSE